MSLPANAEALVALSEAVAAQAQEAVKLAYLPDLVEALRSTVHSHCAALEAVNNASEKESGEVWEDIRELSADAADTLMAAIETLASLHRALEHAAQS